MTTAADPAALASRVAALEGENRVLADTLAKANGTAAQTGAQLAALTTERAALTTERDAFKVQIAELAPKAAKLGELEVTVTALTNEKHERMLISELRNSGKLPGADELTLSGVLVKLHEAGTVNRFAADPKAEAAKALPIISAAAPTLTRPPTSGGGSPGAPTAQVRRAVSLIRP